LRHSDKTENAVEWSVSDRMRRCPFTIGNFARQGAGLRACGIASMA
jgi:hypothetical protein